MKFVLGVCVAILVMADTNPGFANEVVGEPVSFEAEDGLEITAYWREAETAAHAPTILLFHMAGSSARGEYGEIAPILNKAGYNTLAVDLRAGGDRTGAPNQTAQRFGDGDISYCDTYPDMVASLAWVKARDNSAPIIAWGSSFSAALVIKLAAQHPDDIDATLAFSPASGEPMAGCRPEGFLENLATPLLALRPKSEMEYPSVITQAQSFKRRNIPYLEIANGAHGSLMLLESRTKHNMDHAWQPVLAFLRQTSGRVQTSDVRLAVDGWRLFGKLTIPHKYEQVAAVLLLHGAAGSKEVYDGLANELANRGIASLRLDLRAHGQSANKGVFGPPYADNRPLLEGTEEDIIAGLDYLRNHEAIDTGRLAVVGASYSGEYMALAARSSNYENAYVALSPGSFSDQSIAALDASGANWLFVRAEIEQPFFDDIFGAIRKTSNRAEIQVLPGKGHATDLLTSHAGLADQLSKWLAVKLAE